MEKQDLRIGNWVYSQEIGENVQISSINDEYITFKDCATWDYPSYDEIHPIPLTEEILLKCGFEYDIKNLYSLNNKHINFYIKFNIHNNGFYLTIEGFYIIRVKHLHQLQNLYHALTWEELEIEL